MTVDRDILLDEYGDFEVSAGDLVLCEDMDCLVQDLVDRIQTIPGTYVEDVAGAPPEKTPYGAGLPLFVHLEDTPAFRNALRMAVLSEVAKEMRALPQRNVVAIDRPEPRRGAVRLSFVRKSDLATGTAKATS